MQKLGWLGGNWFDSIARDLGILEVAILHPHCWKSTVVQMDRLFLGKTWRTTPSRRWIFPWISTDYYPNRRLFRYVFWFYTILFDQVSSFLLNVSTGAHKWVVHRVEPKSESDDQRKTIFFPAWILLKHPNGARFSVFRCLTLDYISIPSAYKTCCPQKFRCPRIWQR